MRLARNLSIRRDSCPLSIVMLNRSYSSSLLSCISGSCCGNSSFIYIIHNKDTGCVLSCNFAIQHDKAANHIQRPCFNGLSNGMGLPGKVITGECSPEVGSQKPEVRGVCYY